jgi:hypothetical protein
MLTGWRAGTRRTNEKGRCLGEFVSMKAMPGDLNSYRFRIQQVSDFLDQPPVNERFGFVLVTTCLYGLLHFFGEGMSGQRDDRYGRGDGIRPNLPSRFPAI